MKQFFLSIIALTIGVCSVSAVSNNYVEIVFNGSSATVTVANNIKNYVTVSSGTSSHVVITQNASFAGVNSTTSNPDGEIFYSLKGTSTNGGFYLEGAYKCTVELNGLTLTNTSGPAINIQNGKRVSVSVKSGTTNTIADAANDTYNGCFHCKGHTKFKGKGTLNVTGNSKHAIYSKEYIEIKNLTLNVNAATKDGIHCKEYFLMESGTVNIKNVGDDGIQVEQDTSTGSVITGVTTDHEDENSGNFYMTGGTLNISNYTASAVKADGTASLTGGTRNFTDANVIINADINSIAVDETPKTVFDLNGRQMHSSATLRRGIYIVKGSQKNKKVIIK